MERPRYQDYITELAHGRAYGVFVDDTGSPGFVNAPPNVHPERKSWVAVIIPPSVMPEVLNQLPQALHGLREFVGADEFHFTDIYAGRGQFKSVDLQVRLAIFEFMAYIFATYRFPIIVQTFDPETLADVRSRLSDRLPDRLPPFDFTRQEDTALFFLMIRLKWFMEQTPTYPDVKARVFIDEGYKKNGICLKIPTFQSVFSDGLVSFARSSSVLPIQLADFAAFALNRMQLIGGKPERSALDNRVLQILSAAAFDYQNIEKCVVSLAERGPLIPPKRTPGTSPN